MIGLDDFTGFFQPYDSVISELDKVWKKGKKAKQISCGFVSCWPESIFFTRTKWIEGLWQLSLNYNIACILYSALFCLELKEKTIKNGNKTKSTNYNKVFRSQIKLSNTNMI